jgi:hypothetical protein
MNTNYLELSDFSPAIYRQNSDVSNFTDDELINHYLQYGIEEGRIYNSIINRKSFLQLVIQSGNMLEIGPLDRPQLDASSPNYHSIDVFTKRDLQEFYKNDPDVNTDQIIEPTYVIGNNDYSSINKKFKCIFSSHSIEHMPCLVTFLQNIEGLLEDDGYIYFIVPDKRYCFDYYKKETDIYDVIQLYYEKNYRPRFADVLKMRTLSTHNNSIDHWLNEHGENDFKRRLFEQYNNILDEYNTGRYLDTHVSYLTPHSFLTIIEILKGLGLIALDVKKMFHTIKGSNEFYTILRKA